jgi:ATP phosphoribosyltransferase regulatory subunit
VLHTRPDKPHATREPLQFGAEIFGHAGLEADLETLLLALDCLQRSGVRGASVDLAHARIVQVLLADLPMSARALAQIHAALAAKDAPELNELTQNLPTAVRDGLRALVQLYGDSAVLVEAERALKAFPAVQASLSELTWLARQLSGASVTFDLADLSGYAYYSGVRFSIYAQGASDALVRGGRYDEVGAVFGRKRPAAGFSLDIKALVGAAAQRALRAAVRAAWTPNDEWRAAVAKLRQCGETVVCVLPGHESEVEEFHCDRELVSVGGQWLVQAL